MTDSEKLNKIADDVDAIRRGLYGDPVNKVKGLMQEHYEMREEVTKMKDWKKKFTWIITGFVAAVQAALVTIKEWMK